MEIIPAILAKDFSEVQQKINQVEPFCAWAQIDVVDGVFAQNKTWNNPEELNDLKTNINLEVHLMVADVVKEVERWIKSPVKRIIFHFEMSAQNEKDNVKIVGEMIKKIKDAGKEVGMAINPKTSWQVLEPYLNDLSVVLYLSVNPGFYASPFEAEVIPKIKSFRQAYPNAIIAIDGGVNSDTIAQIKDVGVDRICVGSYIFKNNIEQAINSLK